MEVEGLITLETSGADTPLAKSLALLTAPEICVICLDKVAEKATASPCQHDQFDFLCLGTWLQQQQRCPLCKAEVRAIRYVAAKTHKEEILELPMQNLPQQPQSEINRRRRQRQGTLSDSRGHRWPEEEDPDIAFRHHIYQQKLYSLRVGTNRISGYRNVTSQSFVQDARLVSRARKWIRRELAVFDFLNPDSVSFGRADRRATNAEFLLEYIVAILKAIDVRGSSGQAEELLREYLGRDNANLFLHELENWLRSPFEQLKDWDEAVQYAGDQGEPFLRRGCADERASEILDSRKSPSKATQRWPP